MTGCGVNSNGEACPGNEDHSDFFLITTPIYHFSLDILKEMIILSSADLALS